MIAAKRETKKAYLATKRFGSVYLSMVDRNKR
jgi:hypothetical protein